MTGQRNDKWYRKAMESEGSIDRDGFQVGYRIEGTGTPTIVIGSTVYYPRTFLGTIRQHLQLVFIDHRGFSPSPEGPVEEPVTMATLLADIDALRMALGLERFIIIGHSGHAFLALEYAKVYPQYVSHVVLIGASPDLSEATSRLRATFFETTATVERQAAFADNMAQLPAKLAAEPDKRFVHFCVSAGPISWYDATFDASPLWEDVYTNMPIIDTMWGELFRDIDITQGLDTFTKPVWLALGQYDYLTGTPFLWASVQHRFQNLTIRVFEESSHTPQYEEADLFNQALVEWLQQTPIT